MLKKIFIIFFLFSYSLSNAQEKDLIVNGHLKPGSYQLSETFKQNLFCFKKGDYLLSFNKGLDRFIVDSVISGTFKNSRGELSKVPFELMLLKLNECTFLEYNNKLSLRIKNFPHTSYYYIDSIEQVSPNKQYSEKVESYRQNHNKTLEILLSGTNQEKKNALDKTNYPGYRKNADYRYIKYLIPYITSKDTILDFHLLAWDGYDKKGNMIGGTDTIYEKKPFADYILEHISKIPFDVPFRSDTINWEEWYHNIISKEKCFPEVKYAKSNQTNIAPSGGISYFLPDIKNRMVYFKSRLPYSFNVDNDELTMKRSETDKYNELSYIWPNIVPRNNEIVFFQTYESIVKAKLKNGAYYKQEIIDFKDLKYDKTHKIERSFPYTIFPAENDYILFWGEDINEHNYAKIGKLDRKANWIIKPKTILDFKQTYYYNSTPEVGSLSYLHASDSTYLLAFSVKDLKKKNNSTLFLKKTDLNLNVIDSVSFTLNFPDFDYRFSESYLVKNKGLYLLLCVTRHNRGKELYCRVFNDKLIPQTDLIQISSYTNYVARPIATNDGFIISWTDNEIIDNCLRSVLITDQCKSSKTINIMCGQIKSLYLYEFNKNNIDIYIDHKNKLIRKRINTEEFKSP